MQMRKIHKIEKFLDEITRKEAKNWDFVAEASHSNNEHLLIIANNNSPGCSPGMPIGKVLRRTYELFGQPVSVLMYDGSDVALFTKSKSAFSFLSKPCYYTNYRVLRGGIRLTLAGTLYLPTGREDRYTVELFDAADLRVRRAGNGFTLDVLSMRDPKRRDIAYKYSVPNSKIGFNSGDQYRFFISECGLFDKYGYRGDFADTRNKFKKPSNFDDLVAMLDAMPSLHAFRDECFRAKAALVLPSKAEGNCLLQDGIVPKQTASDASPSTSLNTEGKQDCCDSLQSTAAGCRNPS